MCCLRNKKYEKRLDTHVRHLGEQISLIVDTEGRIAQRGRPGVRRRTRVSQPCVTYNFVRSPKVKKQRVKREKLT